TSELVRFAAGDADPDLVTVAGTALAALRKVKSEAKVTQRTEFASAELVLPEAEHTHVHSVLEDLKAAGRVAGELTVRAAAADAEEAQAVGLRDRARIVQAGRGRRHTGPMRAVQYSSYGGPDVLELGEAPEPHPGPGEVRIAVEAAAVNPMDTKLRSGMFAS